MKVVQSYWAMFTSSDGGALIKKAEKKNRSLKMSFPSSRFTLLGLFSFSQTLNLQQRKKRGKTLELDFSRFSLSWFLKFHGEMNKRTYPARASSCWADLSKHLSGYFVSVGRRILVLPASMSLIYIFNTAKWKKETVQRK